MRFFSLALAVAACALAAAPSPARAAHFGITAEGGYHSLTAKDSAQAVFDSTGGPTFGGSLRFALSMGLYVEAGARTFSSDGHRVIVAKAGDPVYPLTQYPVALRVTPVYGSVGFRFGHHRLVPYLAAGGGITLNDETDEVVYTDETNNVLHDKTTSSSSKAGYHGLVGVEYGKGLVRFAVEGRYSTVANAVGTSGVSKIYDETDLGGMTVLGRVTFVFGKSR